MEGWPEFSTQAIAYLGSPKSSRLQKHGQIFKSVEGPTPVGLASGNGLARVNCLISIKVLADVLPRTSLSALSIFPQKQGSKASSAFDPCF